MRPWLLVIDSDLAVVSAFQKALERRGFLVVATDSMSEALGALKVDQPEAVIVEVRVPGAPGVEFLRYLKTEYPGLPIIVMTAYSTSFTESDARREGVAAYFVKPFNIDAMIEELQKTMNRSAGALTSSPSSDLARWPRRCAGAATSF